LVQTKHHSLTDKITITTTIFVKILSRKLILTLTTFLVQNWNRYKNVMLSYTTVLKLYSIPHWRTIWNCEGGEGIWVQQWNPFCSLPDGTKLQRYRAERSTSLVYEEFYETAPSFYFICYVKRKHDNNICLEVACNLESLYFSICHMHVTSPKLPACNNMAYWHCNKLFNKKTDVLKLLFNLLLKCFKTTKHLENLKVWSNMIEIVVFRSIFLSSVGNATSAICLENGVKTQNKCAFNKILTSGNFVILCPNDYKVSFYAFNGEFFLAKTRFFWLKVQNKSFVVSRSTKQI